jgi:transposase InsO family protein
VAVIDPPRLAVFRLVNRYNPRRRHSYCGHQAPILYEQQHAATLQLVA